MVRSKKFDTQNNVPPKQANSKAVSLLDTPPTERMFQKTRVWLLLIGLVFCIAAVLTSGFLNQEHDKRFSVQKARILAADDSALSPEPYIDGMLIGQQPLTIELLTGEFKGQQVAIVNSLNRVFNNYAQKDMVMLFNVQAEDGAIVRVDMFGYSRDYFIYALVGIFILVLVVIGRMKGVYSALALTFTLVTVIFFMMPLILKGYDPILMAVFTSAITTIFTIFLISGVSLKSFAAIGGIILGVAIAGIVGVVSGKLGHISGINMSDAEEVIYLAQEVPIKVPQLLFAGIIISALGAVMDVGMSIASAVFEVKQVNPNLTMGQLYKSGMNIGRDVMGTMSNTLILAFAGSSISILIIIILYKLPYIRLINLNLLAIEVIQGISGSIGLILTVPVTAILAAALASDNKLTRACRRLIEEGFHH